MVLTLLPIKDTQVDVSMQRLDGWETDFGYVNFAPLSYKSSRASLNPLKETFLTVEESGPDLRTIHHFRDYKGTIECEIQIHSLESMESLESTLRSRSRIAA